MRLIMSDGYLLNANEWGEVKVQGMASVKERSHQMFSGGTDSSLHLSFDQKPNVNGHCRISDYKSSILQSLINVLDLILATSE